jgi:hypothetical protein
MPLDHLVDRRMARAAVSPGAAGASHLCDGERPGVDGAIDFSIGHGFANADVHPLYLSAQDNEYRFRLQGPEERSGLTIERAARQTPP